MPIRDLGVSRSNEKQTEITLTPIDQRREEFRKFSFSFYEKIMLCTESYFLRHTSKYQWQTDKFQNIRQFFFKSCETFFFKKNDNLNSNYPQ